MVRALVYGLTLLHLGPGLAFALLAFGCEGPAPVIGAVCSMNVLEGFAALTLGSWVVLGAGASAVHLVGRARAAGSRALAPRLRAFAALLLSGSLVGASAQALTGSQYFYLAIPGALALGWLLLANPQECSPG